MKSLNKNLTNEAYWVNAWDKVKFEPNNFKYDSSNPIYSWLNSITFAQKEGAKCLEIGCFPGKFLTIFGDKGYELHGIDLVQDVETFTPFALSKLGYSLGEFTKIDFFDFTIDNKKKYDVVCSFGLIEHFVNWEEVFKMHLDLVCLGGYVVIETPNFRTFPHWLIKRFLDKRALSFHNLNSMNPDKWAQILSDNGFEVISNGGIGKFSWWTSNPELNKIQMYGKTFLRMLTPLISKILPKDSKLFSPIYGIVGKKVV